MYWMKGHWNFMEKHPVGMICSVQEKYNWDVTNITGGLIQTQLSETTFKSKYGLRPIPITWLNTLSNGQELGNNPGWE